MEQNDVTAETTARQLSEPVDESSVRGEHRTASARSSAAVTRRVEARAFCEAAAALENVAARSDEELRFSSRAALALVRLAELDTRDVLALALRPDPANSSVTWTVACYRIGDLVPCELRDYTNPVQAVLALSSCKDSHHLAAELICSNELGMRWSALSRSGSEVSFRLVGIESASCRESAAEGSLQVVQDRWHDQLSEWESRGDALFAQLDDEVDSAHGEDPNASLQLGAERSAGRLDALETLVAQMNNRLGELERRLNFRDEADDE